MSDIVERLKRRGETLEALSNETFWLKENRTSAWQAESIAAMRQAAKDNATAFDEIISLRGTMSADDERLRLAADRVGIHAGCDAPDAMADEITSLRQALAASEQREKEARRLALEDAAKVVESEVRGITIDRFSINERDVKNSAGHSDFVSTIQMCAYLNGRADAIRAMKSEEM